jgi:hypothetical protein
MKAPGGGGGNWVKHLIILNLGTKWGGVVSVKLEAGWAPEPVWTQNLEENPLLLSEIEPRSSSIKNKYLVVFNMCDNNECWSISTGCLFIHST